MLYILIFCVIVIFFVFFSSSLRKGNEIKTKNNYIKTICLIFVLFSGLRNLGVGEDTYAYYIGYENTKSISWKQLVGMLTNFYNTVDRKDIGYTVFEKITQIFTNNFQIYLFLVAIIFYISFYNFLKNNTNKITEAFLAIIIFYVLFFYVFSITSIRQSLALAATFYCYELIKKRKLLLFLCVLLLTSLIHKSVLIFIPFYFLCNIKNTKWIFPTTLLIFPLIMVFKNQLTFFLLGFGGYEEYKEFDGSGTINFTIIFLMVCIFTLYRKKVLLKQDANNIHYYNAMACALVLLPLSWINPALLRITMYFSIYMILLIPKAINSLNKIPFKGRREIVGWAVIVLFILFIRTNYTKEYRFYWEPIKLGENYNE
ncbi:EpsG family protein [Empedobacter sp. UBA6745]|uniref:EpsG family protein n=1 Tax=Empedobacter sp. UBA6745 TaxID=1946447 RepID=UPI0025BD81B4|nr:EpsG family protein [Empedobacter sp. UBA6745]